MKLKLSALFLLTAILAISLVSAAIDVSQPGTLKRSLNSTTFTITNSYPIYENTTCIITISPINISDGSGNYIKFPVSPSAPITLASNGTTNQIITISHESIPSSFGYGVFSSPININSNCVNNTNLPFSFTLSPVSLSFVNDFCSDGENGTDIEILNVEDNQIDNEDAWQWQPLNNIEIDVKIKNNRADSIDVIIEYDLYDPESNEFILDNPQEVDLSIDEKSSETATIDFEIPTNLDFDSSSKDYYLFIKAYEDGDEEAQCVSHSAKLSSSYYQRIRIEKNKNDVIVTNIDSIDNAMCGETIDISARLTNIGRNDEKKVKVQLTSSELSINQEIEVDSLDTGSSKEVTFTITVPADVQEKIYNLDFTTYMDYDKDDKTYGEVSDKEFKKPLKVEGNCQSSLSAEDVRITATLESDAVAGQEITVQANVQNTGTKETTYNLIVSGVESLGTLVEVDPQTLTLKAGASKNVLITINANDDSSGDYTFTIKAIYGGKTKDQSVSVTVQGKQSLISGSFLESLKSNWLIWVIVLVNVVLIILIILVAVKISRR